MKSKTSKKRKIDQRTPFRISAYEKRKQDRLGLSVVISFGLHGLLFLVLFFTPISFDYIPPTITLEIWEPGEEVPEIPEPEIAEISQDYMQQARLAAVVARFKELRYDPSLKQQDIAPPRTVPPPIRSTIPRPIAPIQQIEQDQGGDVQNPFDTQTESMTPSLNDEWVGDDSESEEAPSNESVIGEELAQILDGTGEGQWLGETLMNLYLSKRVLLVNPDLRFLSDQAFTSKTKVVTIEVNILPDGTVEDAKIIFPGTGNHELDQRLRLVFLQVLFNDVTPFGRGVEMGTIVLNFKG